MKQYLHLDRDYRISGYTTETELEVLEFLSFSSFESDSEYEPMVDHVLEKCVEGYSLNIPKINKILMLWAVRMVTLGNEATISFKCQECKQRQDLTIDLQELVTFPTMFSEKIKRKIVESSSGMDLTEEINDEMEMEEYEDFLRNISNYYVLYSHKFSFKCQYCHHENFTDFISFKSALSFLSEDSYTTLSEWIHALVYYGKHSREDILKMTPIQRMLEIKYFNETMKKEEFNVVG